MKLTKIYNKDGSYYQCFRVETKLKEAKRLKKILPNKQAQQKVINDLKQQVKAVRNLI